MDKGQLRTAEELLLSVGEEPWSTIYRATAGVFILPVFSLVFGKNGSASALVVFFLVALLLLRLAPMILRRILPFSTAVKMIWAERRVLARHYDSYQWRKLLGTGLGLAVYLAVSPEAQTAQWILALTCLVSGGAGFVVWRRRTRSIE